MDNKNQSMHGQTGSALVIVLLVLVTITAIGLAALKTSSIDLDITASDKCTKRTWWATDGANKLMTELIELNIEDRGRGPWETGQYGTNGRVAVFTPDFWRNEEDKNVCENNVPALSNRDVQLPSTNDPGFTTDNYADTAVYIKVYGETKLLPGSGGAMNSGSDGLAKGMAGGGSQTIYTIRALGDGAGSCEARILQVWRHIN